LLPTCALRRLPLFHRNSLLDVLHFFWPSHEVIKECVWVERVAQVLVRIEVLTPMYVYIK
jgi:hypothetical protein